MNDEFIFEKIRKHYERKTRLLHATRGESFTNEMRQIARHAIEVVLEEESDENTRIAAFRELRWAVEEFEEKINR